MRQSFKCEQRRQNRRQAGEVGQSSSGEAGQGKKAWGKVPSQLLHACEGKRREGTVRKMGGKWRGS